MNRVLNSGRKLNFSHYYQQFCSLHLSPRKLQDQRDYPYFSRVLESLPKSRSLAFAYGSGVFKQAGKSWTNSSMSDFIIATDNPRDWHEENLRLNPSHYPTTIRTLGASFIENIQINYGARIYFNTLIPFEDGLIKYGVISTKDLVTDLSTWDTLYTAGRLHKPVNILERDKSQTELKTSLENNLDSALYTALLGLPDSFTEKDLFLALTGISYSGDLRMLVGEDKNKVENIVSAQMDIFKDLYSERIKSFSQYIQYSSEEFLTQDKSDQAVLNHARKLPSNLQEIMLANLECNFKARDDVDHKSLTVALKKSISTIVQRSSTPQALKGLVSAGPSKAFTYSLAKLKKMFKSLK